MKALLDALNFLLSPLTAIFVAISLTIPALIGAFKDPAGFVNTQICKLIDLVAGALPSTPANMKMGFMLSFASDMIDPSLRGIFSEIINLIFSLLSIVVIIKIYKLIPFKAT